jgi:group I intron endonuclease
MANIKDREQDFYIYKITNLINKKSYIGITYNFERRKHEHFNGLNKGCKVLYRSIKKYGKENFDMLIIDKTDSWKGAEDKEKYYIKKLNTKAPNGMNLTNGGEGVQGAKFSDAVRKQMSIDRMGRKATKQAKINMSKAQRGKVMSDESKRKISDSHKGIGHTKETRKKLSIINTGKKLSDEHKRKIGIASKNISDETRQKMSDSHKGIVFSDEHKKNISIVRKGIVFSNEHKRNLSKSLKGRVPWNKGKKNIYSKETLQKMSDSSKKKQ